jgi:Flp pilus assembly protein TadD
MTKKISLKSLLMIGTCALLAACQTTQEAAVQKDRTDKVDSVLNRAAINAHRAGKTQQSLAILEKIYQRNSEDERTAIDYARVLREHEYLNRASIVLAPFANDPNTSAESKVEFAAIQLAKGNYDNAENFAKKAVTQDEKNYQAYHYLGIALDAQSMHAEAERAFRKGLEHWEGDPTSIMNNLALSLASQGFLDEASEILQKAMSISPNRLEVERNLRIVNALQQSHGWYVPKPNLKPKVQATPVYENEKAKPANDGKEEDIGQAAAVPAPLVEPANGE